MQDQRRANRDSLFMLAAVRLGSGSETLRAKVRNLSASGLMAECPLRAEPGAPLMIELRNIGWVAGKVAWIAENRFGVTFDNEIDPLVVRRSLAAPPEVDEMVVRRPKIVIAEPPPPPDPEKLRFV